MAKIKLGKFAVDKAELDRQIAAATKRGVEELRSQPLATRVRYDRRTKRLVVTLNTGAYLEVPIRRLQGLADATDSQLAKVRVLGPGTAVEFSTLDQQFSVAGLLAGLFRTRAWKANLSRDARASASRANSVATRKYGAKRERHRAHAAVQR